MLSNIIGLTKESDQEYFIGPAAKGMATYPFKHDPLILQYTV